MFIPHIVDVMNGANRAPRRKAIRRIPVTVGVLVLCLLATGCSVAPAHSGSTSTGSTSMGSTSSGSAQHSVAEQADKIVKRVSARRLGSGTGLSGSILVAHGEDVIVSKGFGQADRSTRVANTPQTRFRIGSITKQFTAMAVLMLERKGKLAVDDPVCDHLTRCPATWKAVTIRHLLNHTSGIPDFATPSGFDEIVNQPTTPAKTLARFTKRPLAFAPGSDISYSNSGYVILGIIIERVSGTSYGEFLGRHIFDPAGMADTGYGPEGDDLAVGYLTTNADPANIDMSLFAAGALYSTVEDLYRWDRAVVGGMFGPADALADGVPADLPRASDEPGYGFGVEVAHTDGRVVIRHSGRITGFKSVYARYPDDDVSIVILSNQGDQVEIGLLAEDIFRDIRRTE